MQLTKRLHLLFWLFMMIMPLHSHAQNIMAKQWIQNGWQQLEQNNFKAALQSWQHGLNQLPDHQLLASLGVYRESANAIDLLHRIGRKQQAFIIQAKIAGKTVHYILSARHVTSDIKQRQIDLASLKQVAEIKGKLLAIEVRRFKMNSVHPEPDWLQQGWDSLTAQDHQAALIAWQQKLNSLPDQQLLPILGFYSQLEYAIKDLHKVGRDYDTFIVQTEKNKKIHYYLLSARATDFNIIKRQVQLSDLKEAAGITEKLLAREAGRLKTPGFVNVARHNKTPVIAKEKSVQKPLYAVAAEDFTINSFAVSGNSLIPTDLILLGLRDYYGPQSSESGLKEIKKEVIHLYHMSGYYGVAVNISDQLVDDAVVIKINEAKVRH